MLRRFFSGPVLNEPCRCSDYLRINSAFAWQNEELQRRARAVLADRRPAGQFAVLHVPPPHGPFVCGPDGQRDLNAHTNETLASQQVVYLDGVIGGFLDELRARGKYDNSTIILTSDHNWREDPALENTAHAHSHVPLLIRFPGQAERVTVTAPFSTSALARLLDYMRATPDGWRQLDSIAATRQWHFPIADEELEIKTIPSR